MIYLIVGEDTASSFNYFSALKKNYESKKYQLHEISKENIDELGKWLADSQELFSTNKVFFASNILSDKAVREKLKKYDVPSKDIDIVIWEEKLEERVAKFLFKYAHIKSFKLNANIFKLLDSIYPSNMKEVISMMHEVLQTTDSYMVFYMISKRLRELIMIKEGIIPEKLASWQAGKLKTQASKWEGKNLEKCYDSLFRLDTLQKTSQGYYKLPEALDILFSFYIR